MRARHLTQQELAALGINEPEESPERNWLRTDPLVCKESPFVTFGERLFSAIENNYPKLKVRGCPLRLLLAGVTRGPGSLSLTQLSDLTADLPTEGSFEQNSQVIPVRIKD